MSTITTIAASDLVSDSRAVINTNFSNLNTDKLEAATVATLTNKTIDADGTGNVISNIENADIKAAAAIAVNKLAAVTASRALVSDASGFVSPATTTSTEIGQLNGVTATPTASKVPIADGSGKLTGWIDASSLTVAGKVELATTAEINTGTDSTRAIPIDQFVASNRNVRYVVYRVIEAGTAVTTGTVKGGDFEVPFTGTITEVGAWNDTAGVTGTAVYDINLNGTTIMTTNKVTIDTTEKTSRTAATAPTLTTTAITAGDLITFDVDTVHSGTAEKGLTFRIGIRMT